MANVIYCFDKKGNQLWNNAYGTLGTMLEYIGSDYFLMNDATVRSHFDSLLKLKDKVFYPVKNIWSIVSAILPSTRYKGLAFDGKDYFRLTDDGLSPASNDIEKIGLTTGKQMFMSTPNSTQTISGLCYDSKYLYSLRIGVDPNKLRQYSIVDNVIRLVKQQNITTGVTSTGITFDGKYFWILQTVTAGGANQIAQYITTGNGLSQVNAFTGIANQIAITTDGKNLYLLTT